MKELTDDVIGLQDCSPGSNAVIAGQSAFHARCHVVVYIFGSAVSSVKIHMNFYSNCCFWYFFISYYKQFIHIYSASVSPQC